MTRVEFNYLGVIISELWIELISNYVNKNI